MIVTLSWAEMMQAHQIAGQRIAMNIRNGVRARYGADVSRDTDGLHLTACRGEMAVSKALGKYWSGTLGDYSAVDVGGRVEVRSVNGPSRRLILHPTDRDDLPFVLADCGACPEITLRGWILAKDGKQQAWWQDLTGRGRPAFVVPHESLIPFKALMERGVV